MRLLFFVFLFAVLRTSTGQSDSLELQAKQYFQAVKVATLMNIDLWELNLFGPMILVDPVSRKVYASEPDLEGHLIESNGVFVGTFPKSLNISGAYVDWGGKTWAMLPFMFPANTTTTDVVGYLGHELFHRSQKNLGFTFPNEILNEHLHRTQGRIYLRLELRALLSALEETSEEQSEDHLSDALLFRLYRHKLYPNARDTENLLELNEGITQFTTIILRGEPYDSTTAYLKEVALIFLDGPSYVRTFAYHTIPSYGILLRNKKKYWNKEISINTNLTDYFIANFEINTPENLDSTLEVALAEYSGAAIIAEEENRQKEFIEEVEKYKKTLLRNPHFEISISRNNMSFDPSNVTPIEGFGTVYKGNVRWSDKWGVLEVQSGLFLDENRSRICVTIPDSIDEHYAKGSEWELWLDEDYRLVFDEKAGNYIIQSRN